jgi:hypothetical protein
MKILSGESGAIMHQKKNSSIILEFLFVQRELVRTVVSYARHCTVRLRTLKDDDSDEGACMNPMVPPESNRRTKSIGPPVRAFLSRQLGLRLEKRVFTDDHHDMHVFQNALCVIADSGSARRVNS